VCVVADRCTDATVDVAGPHAEVLVQHAALTIGEVRNLGARHLLAALPADGWLLSTDADSVVPPDWVAAHLARAATGADAVVGTVALGDAGQLAAEVVDRYAQLVARPSLVGAEHAYAANLGVRASAFRAVGGFPATPHGEEHALLARLRAAGHRVVRAPEISVRTSARTEGRARGGLADLLRELGA
jgi:hypothetical protein